MANRYFNQFPNTLEKGLVILYADVTIGATGAPTLVTSASKGIASIVRNSAGRYTLTLQDTYVRLLDCQVQVLNATASAAPVRQLISQAVTSLTAPTIVFQCYAADSTTAADPASGEELKIQIHLRNSTAL